MGNVIEISCGCQSREIMTGIGFCFPVVYRETMTAIKDGKYGEDMRTIANNTELVTVDAEQKLYYCSKCGYFEAMAPLDLYKPKDIEKARKQIADFWAMIGDQTDNEFHNELPYWVYHGEEKKDYELIREFVHYCPKCQDPMIKTTAKRLIRKKCPSCNEKYQENETNLFWD